MIPAIVINLDSRRDRWEWILQHFNNVKILKIERFPAIKHNKGTSGCLLSHQTIVKYAKEHNYEMVIVLEDDCKVCSDFDFRFPLVINWLLENKSEWDVFNGGPAYVKINHRTKVLCRQPNILRVSGLMCHFTIYNKSSYDNILNATEDDIIDEYIVDNNLRQVTTVPLLATQIPSQSNAQLGYKNYSREFLRSDRRLHRFLSRH
jgi:GR25 family glycosyltransferase involved in LPS biosynthesis